MARENLFGYSSSSLINLFGSVSLNVQRTTNDRAGLTEHRADTELTALYGILDYFSFFSDFRRVSNLSETAVPDDAFFGVGSLTVRGTSMRVARFVGCISKILLHPSSLSAFKIQVTLERVNEC